MATQESQPWKCPEKSSRNLVVCIDGTSNKFGRKNTNIVELYSHIIKCEKQLTYYSSGLGTVAKVSGPSLRNNISNTLDMAIGRNLHKVIMASYRWLSDNYRDGDSVFLFGFSRGAYQVRALAAMIARVGLLLPGNNEQIPFAFELYSKTKDNEGKQYDEYTELAKTFKGTFCRSNVHIHFIGVWDTVSSVGFSRNRILPCTTTPRKDPHFCYFRHALALDERRVKFLPEYIYGGQSDSDRLASNGRIKEVWFAGCHGDVGGGNRRNEKLQLGDIPLLWMRNQATAVGLEMKAVDVMWKIDDLNKRITNSMRLHWWPMEILFFQHLVYSDSNRCTHRPHFGDPRRIVQGQKVHVSVLFKNHYKPFARFYGTNELWPVPMIWNHASSHERLQELSAVWEKDIFDHHSVRTLLDQLKEGQSYQEVLSRLAFMSTFDVCQKEIETCKDAKDILAKFLNNEDKVIQLSTAAMYCELGWSWPADTDDKLPQQITKSVSELLDSNGRSACIYLPSLCKKIPELINEENLKKLVKLCVGTRIDESEEETSTVAFPGAWAMSISMKRASRFQKRLVESYNGKRTENFEETSTTFFHSAHALFMLMELDANVAQILIDVQAVPNITKTLHYKCDPALVALLNVVDGLAKCEIRDLIEAETTVPIICKLLKHYDDFVAPVAIRVLCSFLPNDKLRDKIHQCNVLPTLCQVLRRCSDKTQQVAYNALAEFVKHNTLRASMLECKVIPIVFDALDQRRSGKTVQAWCNALVEFVKHDNFQDKMLKCDVVPSLVYVLHWYSEVNEAVQVVCNMLVKFVEHPDFRDKVLKHKVFPTLLDSRLWKSEQSMEALCEVLVRFAEHDNLRDKMVKYKVLPTLRYVLCQRSDETTQVVCNTLVKLMQYDKVRVKMLECDVFPSLFEALQDLQLSKKTAEVVSSTLIESVKHDSLRDKMLQNNMFSTLCRVLRQWNSDEHKRVVCNILVEFVKHDNLPDKMVGCDVYPPLCDVLDSMYWSNKTKQVVCNTLVELVKHDTLRDRILECKLFFALFDMLQQQCPDAPTVQVSCNTLLEFVEYDNSRDKMLECDVFPSLDDVLRRVVEVKQVLREKLAKQVARKKLTEQVAHKMLVEQMAYTTLTALVNHDNLQDKTSECMVLSTLYDVLRWYSDETKEVVYNTLVKIMNHENLDRMFKCKVLHILCYVLNQCKSDKTKKGVCNEFIKFVKCDTLQDKMLVCRVLPTLRYVVSQRSDETKKVVCKTMVDLGNHDDCLENPNDLCISLSGLFEGTGIENFLSHK